MKTIFALLPLLLFTSLGVSQEVGINMAEPEYTLDVRATSNDEAAEINISNQDRSRYLRFFSGSNSFPDPSVIMAPGRNLLFASFDDNTLAFNEYMRLSSSGDVGIGIENPEARLDILGGDWNLDAGNAGDLRVGTATNNFRIGIATGGGGAGITRMYTNSNALILGSYDTPMLTLGQNSNVGIGTIIPKAALEVNATALSDTTLLLENTLATGEVDYGVYFKDTNPNRTVGAFIRCDGRGLDVQTNGENESALRGVSINSTGNSVAISGLSFATQGKGVRGESYGLDGTGVIGVVFTAKGTGVYGSGGAYGVHGSSNSGYAGYFEGNVHVTGVLSKASGSFKIDHPLDPENKYLSHSFVESPDMMNIYNGNIITDGKGYATVELSDYFEALNMDFRYQLTVIGEFAQAIIGEKINGNSFKIRTDKPKVEVSWQVTGVRNDTFAQKNRIKVEEDKETENIGKYLNAEAFGQSNDKQIGRNGASQVEGSEE